MLLLCLTANGFKLFNREVQISDELIVDGVTYNLESNSRESDGFVGFFDWLRRDESNIIGLRLCFFQHYGYNDLFVQFPYVKSTYGGKCVEITFTQDAYNEDLSGDQDFSQNYVYKSNDGYLVTFNPDHLSKGEVESLKPYLSPV